MGKRSNFERREADFYPTPRAAVLPLIPYLRRDGIRTFAEPCCRRRRFGTASGIVWPALCLPGDIRTGQDALARDHYAAPVITNPPYRYPTDGRVRAGCCTI